MMHLRRTFLKFSSLFNNSKAESDLEAEIAAHLLFLEDEFLRNGMSPQDARLAARRAYGGVEQAKQLHRNERSYQGLARTMQDIRYAARVLRRSPGFTLVAIASLALGIGANTIIFTLAKGVLLDKLAVPKPEKLRLLSLLGGDHSPISHFWGNYYFTADGRMSTSSFSYPVFKMLQQQNRAHPVLEDLFAFKLLNPYSNLTVAIDGHADAVNAQIVSGNYYQQLGVKPQLGRTIQPADDGVPGTGAVAVISDGMWARFFGRSASIIGKTIRLNLIPVTIIGVNPPGFTGAASVQLAPDVFFPFSMQPVIMPLQDKTPLLDDKDLWWVQIMGRALPGVTQERAKAALAVWLEQDIRTTLAIKKEDRLPVLSVDDGSQGIAEANHDFAMQLHFLFALTGFVLLLACANLANLLLARSAARQREISVRLALGASRGRVLRQVMTESLLLSSLGGAAGLALGYAGRNVIPHMYSATWKPTELRGNFDLGVFTFAVGISILAGVLFGLAPAWQTTRAQVNSGLKDTSVSTTRRGRGFAGKAIVVFQVALSMVLVVAAGLFARTLMNLNSSSLGFRPENLLLFAIEATPSRYPAPQDVALHQRIEDRLAGVPGVQAVTLTELPMLSNNVEREDFQPTDQPKLTENHKMNFNGVGQNFFDIYRIPILFGRRFGPTDTMSSPRVAVINQAAARKYYSHANPVGETFAVGDEDHPAIYQIIGVCADAKYDNLREDPPPTFYRLYRQSKSDSLMTYVVKTPLPATAILPEIRKAVAEIDRDLPLRDVRTQVQQINATISQQRLFATLTGGFGFLALVVACIGIYGIMAYDVERRTSEIGIRMALGAKAGQMLRMVLVEASWIAAIGVGAGLGAALLLAHFVGSMLYGLKGNDPMILACAAAVLVAAAVLSGWLPARRASRIEPMVALRHE
jgi:predicted permease